MDGSIPSNYSFPLNTPRVADRSAGAAGSRVGPGEAPAARRADTVEWSGRTTGAAMSGKVSKLVAGAVDVPVTFDSPRPAGPASDGAISMYRHPADRNIAATGVTLGRRVDVTG